MTYRRPLVGRRAHRICSPENIILESPQTAKIRYRDGGTDDIIETIMHMDAESGAWVDTDAAQCLRGDTLHETLHNVWAFVKHHNRYRADSPGHERVKSPGALFTSRTGDCKSYSIAEGALLRALGIRYKYRFSAYNQGDFTHVYVLAETPQGWTPLDAVHDKPFEEVWYVRKKDIPPKTKGIAGLPAKAEINYMGIAILAMLIMMTGK